MTGLSEGIEGGGELLHGTGAAGQWSESSGGWRGSRRDLFCFCFTVHSASGMNGYECVVSNVAMSSDGRGCS